MTPTQRDALMLACKVLDHAAEVADRPGLMRTCEEAADALRAALAQQAEPVSEEPVAWKVRSSGATGTPGPWRIYQQSAKPGVNRPECCDFQPLYTHPPRREPLTMEQLREIIDKGDVAQPRADGTGWYVLPYSLARAIERAHGIGGDE
jgi:hypothetical protein